MKELLVALGFLLFVGALIAGTVWVIEWTIRRTLPVRLVDSKKLGRYGYEYQLTVEFRCGAIRSYRGSNTVWYDSETAEFQDIPMGRWLGTEWRKIRWASGDC